MAEIDYVKEKCWRIKEELPVKVFIKEYWTGKGFVISPLPLTMTYKTYEHLYQNHSTPWPARWKGSEEFNSRPATINVRVGSYDYHNGECCFNADTREEIDKWLNFYKEYVTLEEG